MNCFKNQDLLINLKKEKLECALEYLRQFQSMQQKQEFDSSSESISGQIQDAKENHAVYSEKLNTQFRECYQRRLARQKHKNSISAGNQSNVSQIWNEIFMYREHSTQIPQFARPGDWVCFGIKCNNLNFGFRQYCKKCGLIRPQIKVTGLRQMDSQSAIQQQSNFFNPAYEGDWICQACNSINDKTAH